MKLKSVTVLYRVSQLLFRCVIQIIRRKVALFHNRVELEAFGDRLA